MSTNLHIIVNALYRSNLTKLDFKNSETLHNKQSDQSKYRSSSNFDCEYMKLEESKSE